MSYAELDIWNQALWHLAETREVQSLTENSPQARGCRRFYDVAREKTLKDAPWPFCKQYTLLAQITNTVPITEFQFAYRYPANCLLVRRILNGVWRVESRQSRIPYQIGADAVGNIIYCDVAPITGQADPTTNMPFVEYTFNEQNTGKFTADYVTALARLLASMMGPGLAGDKKKVVDECTLKYEQLIVAARINAFNEDEIDEEQPSEFERSRIDMSFATGLPWQPFPKGFTIDG